MSRNDHCNDDVTSGWWVAIAHLITFRIMAFILGLNLSYSRIRVGSGKSYLLSHSMESSKVGVLKWELRSGCSKVSYNCGVLAFQKG